eukprot:TRINITY_DN6935_c0_g1_i1.p2 TRINITY_DN6935_c0_g1~~TRINITY_DN6935_c0_g1_i1.p2  ORF type:complete len:143 (-),score=14.63 TRINITY_DN6935_c0_g1_i1:127-555(-)
MPRYYCDYCDIFLTHDSPAVRKQHNSGYKHKANVRNYYMQFEEIQSQVALDTRMRDFEMRKQVAFQQHVAQQMAQAGGVRPPVQPLAPPPGWNPRMPPPGFPPPGFPQPGQNHPGPFPPGFIPPGASQPFRPPAGIQQPQPQ